MSKPRPAGGTGRSRRRAPRAGRGRQGELVVRARAWIERDGRPFLGAGRALLLERIAEHGSISAAARSMDMSYRHAWDLIASMNRAAGRRLVETTTGGEGGGGARLTEAGRAAIRAFRHLTARLREFEEGLAPEVRRML